MPVCGVGYRDMIDLLVAHLVWCIFVRPKCSNVEMLLVHSEQIKPTIACRITCRTDHKREGRGIEGRGFVGGMCMCACWQLRNAFSFSFCPSS